MQHTPTSYWVVTPLVPASGPAVPVARATVSSPGDPAVASVTPGFVTVVGVAQPFEGDPGGTTTLPAGQVERLTAAALGLPYPAVVAPSSADAPAGLRLQNAAYAVQWVLFAAFVVFFWWRLLRDDLRGAGIDRPRQEATPVREVY